MSTNIKNDDLQGLFQPRSEEKEIEHDSLMLMAAFLSEIELFQEKKNITRKELAEKIKTSPSYLTQVFRSKKPLNFLTLAKIKRALNLRFEVKAFEKEPRSMHTIATPVYKHINARDLVHEAMLMASDVLPQKGSTFITEGKFSDREPQNIRSSHSVTALS